MALTDAACRAAKGREKLYKLSDGGGLQLWVHPSGSRTWRLAYRHNGRQKSMTLGTYPDMKLVEVRDKRDVVKRTLRDGDDPEKRVEREQKHTFRDTAKKWFDVVKTPWCAAHADRVWSRIEKDAFPSIGDTDVRDIKSSDVLLVLQKIEGRGAIDMAKRVRQSISSVLRYAIALEIIEYDVTANIKGLLKAAPKTKRHAFIREAGVPELLKRIDAYDGDPLTRLAIRFTLETMVRTKEVRFADWNEFEGLDTDAPLWRIPGERMKRRLEHLVPLSKQSVITLDQIRQYSGSGSFLFRAATASGAMSENTMLYALYRMGYHSRATVHGFRSTASTILNESGLFHSDWIERQLAHVEENKIRAAYNAAEWLSQRRGMLQWWCDLLDEKRSAKMNKRMAPPDNLNEAA